MAECVDLYLTNNNIFCLTGSPGASMIRQKVMKLMPIKTRTISPNRIPSCFIDKLIISNFLII